MKKKRFLLTLTTIGLLYQTNIYAQELEDFIKEVDISGTLSYRYNDYETDKKAGKTQNFYKLALNVSKKINENVTLNTRFLGERFSINTGKQADEGIDINLSEVNFLYTGIKDLSITFGKQAIYSPWTTPRDAMGDENTGTGIYAVYNKDVLTLSAAYFNQTNFNKAEISTWNGIKGIDGSEDLAIISAYLNLPYLSLDLAYSDLEDIYDSYSIGLNSNFKFTNISISTFTRYTSLDLDNSNKDNSLWQIGLIAKKGIYSLFTAYGQTNKEGGKVSIDTSAKTNMDYGWRITASNDADAKYFYISTNANVTTSTNLGIYYSSANYGSNSRKEAKDLTNIYLQIKYKMSKNLISYLRYGTLKTQDEGTGNVGRLNIQYSF
ncbi:hypothetical protein CPU12_05675 [Malaciobacter molluscorum LMG 25693]|uniref:Campylo_MOMP domain-containing protein n=1 Tax=Malaciobacter molluscorum LMG 25693 TaxID=870501 RepID=A0A2G1DJ35_9BACT|nr:major outer membrane protein [Malaciobacter molluscorum]AXX93228.1 Campylo_MOMP domain-containing protein [Malaciobacter molluscorum LMG 25693]PHO18481.1 hypothetical protein CPU12_05675 [Malaciobacter molluscorum LMG 25693]